MGTRSTVKFYSGMDAKNPVASIYQQYDGYISGVGHDLANWLLSKKIVNGFGLDQRMNQGFANGIGCLAAQYVAENKKEIGGFYLTTESNEQEYNYKVILDGTKFHITVDDIFQGSPEELLAFNESEVEDQY